MKRSLLRELGLPRELADAAAKALRIRYGHHVYVIPQPDCGVNWWFLSVAARADVRARMREYLEGFVEGSGARR